MYTQRTRNGYWTLRTTTELMKELVKEIPKIGYEYIPSKIQQPLKIEQQDEK